MKQTFPLLLVALLTLAACGTDQDIPYASPTLGQEAAPAEGATYASAPSPRGAPTDAAPGHSTMDMVIAGGAGYLLGQSSARSAPAVVQQPTTIIHQTVVRNVTAREPKTKAQAVPPDRSPKTTTPVASRPAMTFKPAPAPSRPAYRPISKRK